MQCSVVWAALTRVSPFLSRRKRVQMERTKRIGNDVYSLTFDNTDNFPTFGARYMFWLEDAVDSPEYLVHFPTLLKCALCRRRLDGGGSCDCDLCRLAGEVGLELVEYKNFHDFYHAHRERHGDLLRRMRVPDPFPPSQWEAVGIYLAAVFRKRPGFGAPAAPVAYPLPRPVSLRDIIELQPPAMAAPTDGPAPHADATGSAKRRASPPPPPLPEQAAGVAAGDAAPSEAGINENVSAESAAKRVKMDKNPVAE